MLIVDLCAADWLPYSCVVLWCVVLWCVVLCCVVVCCGAVCCVVLCCVVVCCVVLWCGGDSWSGGFLFANFHAQFYVIFSKGAQPRAIGSPVAGAATETTLGVGADPPRAPSALQPVENSVVCCLLIVDC